MTDDSAAPCSHRSCHRCKHCGESIEYVPVWAAQGFAPWAHTATGNSICHLVAAPQEVAAAGGTQNG